MKSPSIALHCIDLEPKITAHVLNLLPKIFNDTRYDISPRPYYDPADLFFACLAGLSEIIVALKIALDVASFR